MKKFLNLVTFLLLTQFCSFGQEPAGIDPFNTYENIPSSPEVGSLGTHGQISASPYNGKADINVPIHTIDFDGKKIPLALTYNSGGVRVSQEASWVGLNWSLSGVSGVSRQIFGFDDFSDRIAGNYDNAPLNGYIYNDLNLVLEEGASRPYLDYNDILNVHHSFTLTDGIGSGSRFLDTQPDVFHLNIFGKIYNFILKKKAGTNVLETQIFNSNNAIITYDLVSEQFKLIDEDGFTYYFGTKEINTTFSTVTENTPPSSYESAFANAFVETHRENESIITNWALDKVVSPKGKVLNFNYQPGLYFTFPQYNFDYEGHDYVTRYSWPNEQYSDGGRKKNYSVSFTAIENNYLTNITGPFGRIELELEDRYDLCTGSTLDELSGGYFGLKTLYTSQSNIGACHGTTQSCYGNTLLPKRLSTISVINREGDLKLNADLQFSYFNSNYQGVGERFLRLKLDKVLLNDQNYAFSYLNSNSLVAKDSDGVDFWGFSNGKESINDGLVPTIGKFVTSRIYRTDNSTEDIGQSFIHYSGANRSSDFNYGKVGLLNEIKYPTGGKTIIQYEPHDIVLSAPEPFEVTEKFPNSNRMRWTNMIDESNFQTTYQYLKYANDPNYNYFEKTEIVEPGNAITIGISLNSVFQVDFASLLEINGTISTYTGWSGISYWSDYPILVVEEINTGQETVLYTYGNAPSSMGSSPRDVSKTISLAPGAYRVIRRSADIPPGDNYEDYPPIPAVNFSDQGTYLHTFESENAGDLSDFFDRFEIGGARVSDIINKDSDGKFISSTKYEYLFPDGVDGLSSSGVLMDDLIFHKKTSGFYSYSPRGYTDFLLTSRNQVGGNYSAAGNHIGYSYVRELEVNNLGQDKGWIDYEYNNKKNEYYQSSFTLPYQWDTKAGTGDPYINILGIDMKWTCSGLDFGNDCAGETYYVSTFGDVTVQNTTLLGLPLKSDYSYSNGKIINRTVYNKQGDLVSKVKNVYTVLKGNLPLGYFASFIYTPVNIKTEENGVVESDIWDTTDGPWGANHHTYFPYKFPLHYGLTAKISSAETTEYYDGDMVITENTSSYNQDTFLVEETKSEVTETDFILNKFYYPYSSEVSSNSGMYALRNENRLSTLVKSERFKNQDQISAYQYNFGNSSATSYLTLPISILKSKANEALIKEMGIERYDNSGNPIEISKPYGPNSVFLYGYNDQYLIARIENATSSEVAQQLGVSVSGLETLDEGNLGAINSLRSSMPDAVITTYTHEPLFGVETITNSQGLTTSYSYDNSGRLKSMKDNENFLLKEFEYNYKSN